MNLGVESLRKILQLEQARGYSNLAVIGGLDRYLHGCLEKTEATEQVFFLKEVCSPGFSYAALSENERKEWVERVLQQLAKVDVASKQPTGVPSPAKGSLDSPIAILKGISSALAAKFARLGVKTVKDMLYFFPRRHLNYSQRVPISKLEPGIEQTTVANIWEAREVKLGSRKGTEVTVGDETGNIRVVWFNQPYLAKRLRTNAQIVLSGKVSLFKGTKVFESPEWETLESEDLAHTGRLVPLYPLTEGLNPRRVRKLVKEVVAQWSPQLVDFLPQEVRDHRSLVDLPQAIQQAHYPDSEQRKDEAR
ncbi:MAG: DNA helicase RecG, partial [Dehalococcoidia bacterium]